MKNSLLCILLFLVSLAHSQTAENQNFRLEYVTYAQGFMVLNGKSLTDSTALKCGKLEVRMRWGNRDTTVYFFPTEQRQIMLPSTGGSVTVQFKTVTACNSSSNGPWQSIVLTTLSLREPVNNRPAAERKLWVMAINGSWWQEITEREFQRNADRYRYHYFIFRPGKVKAIQL